MEEPNGLSQPNGLSERVVLVTGASGGIGAAICRRLAGEVAAVALAYSSNAEPAEALAAEIIFAGGTARAYRADMADADAPTALIDEVEQQLGPVDVLIANHGLAQQARYEDVDALAPGFVETPMLPGDPEQLGRATPIGRVGRPQEVADLAQAVLTNAYVNSQVLSIDGGMHPR